MNAGYYQAIGGMIYWIVTHYKLVTGEEADCEPGSLKVAINTVVVPRADDRIRRLFIYMNHA